MNFECVDGPYRGKRLPCRGEPHDGLRTEIYVYRGLDHAESLFRTHAYPPTESGQVVLSCYVLRRNPTILPITGDGFWQWHYAE